MVGMKSPLRGFAFYFPAFATIKRDWVGVEESALY
jgi:hypothetical protein